MKNILFGWQLGGGRGHINLLHYIANIYSHLGYQTNFIVKSDIHAQCLREQGRILTLSSPPIINLGLEVWSYSDILYAYGYGKSQLLENQINIWRNWIEKNTPELIIADYAPSLVLAAKLEKVKTIVVGNVFTVPPATPVEQMPLFRLDCENKDKVFERQKAISKATKKLGISEPLGKILNGDYTLIFSIPQLDYYAHWRVNSQTAYAGSPDAPFSRNLAVSEGRICAYLKKQWKDYERVVQKYQADCSYDKLSKVFKGCSLLIHHGGSLVTSCLLAGIPQKTFPLHTEQALRVHQLQKLGKVENYEDAYNIADRLKFWNQPIAKKELLKALYVIQN